MAWQMYALYRVPSSLLCLHRRVIGLRPLQASASGKFRLVATVSPPYTCDYMKDQLRWKDRLDCAHLYAGIRPCSDLAAT